MSDLEVDRGRTEAKVDVVDAYSDFEKIATRTSSKRPSFAKVVMAWLISKKITKVEVPSDFPLGLAKELKALGLAVKPSKGSFLPEREIKTLAEIEAMKQQRFDNWYAIITNPVEVVWQIDADGNQVLDENGNPIPVEG